MDTTLPSDYLGSNSPPVGTRLQPFRRDFLKEKCSKNMLNISTNGYILAFITTPKLARHPLILSEYKAHQKDSLASCIQSPLTKNASCLFQVPKPHQRWWPVTDLSKLNSFLQVEKFEMESPEPIRSSPIPRE